MTNERIEELETALSRVHRDKWSNNEQIIAECLDEIKSQARRIAESECDAFESAINECVAVISWLRSMGAKHVTADQIALDIEAGEHLKKANK